MPSAQDKVTAAVLKDVELMRPGTWKLASGEQTFEEKHLYGAERYANRAGARPSPIKIGHTDQRFVVGDGEPALGWLGNLRVKEDNGLVLVGDVTGMPDWLAAAAPDAWPDRSVEGWLDFTAEDGEEYAFVIDALALLGVQPPGVSNLKSLRDLPQLVGVAASARRVIARAPQTTAPEAEEPEKKGAGMDPAKIREALELTSDASDDEVKAALVVAGLAAAPPAVGNSDQVLAANATKAGLITIDPAQLHQYQEGMVRAAALAKRLEAQERDNTIAVAVKAGKFPPARREHYERLWDADPEGTRGLVESLAPGLVPVTAMGYSGGADLVEDDLDRDIARLSQPSGRGV
jgi:Mu-like prophage I protein